ncbi:MAG: type II toxin-antitoxin system RelE/ParE family toxin [Lentimicrobiaceae bacterium]|nr:type II toxin-antitoxin system RelE/ParE family toxin [Lentimicrobiaceae bacterium]
MEKFRVIVAYKDYFEKFLSRQPERVKAKIFKILNLVESQQKIPDTYIKHIIGTDGLYETRFSIGNQHWRVFCFFDGDQLVILLSGFQKKSVKTPRREIIRALKLRKEYFHEKNRKK